MKRFLTLINLSFLPSSESAALLLLRVWTGLSMLLLHGWRKAENLGQDVTGFPDPLNITPQFSHALAVFSEAVCSVLLVIGCFTRFSALAGFITMAVAFFITKKAVLTPQGGELAYVYMACYAVLFVAGPGRYSLDHRMAGRGGQAS